MAAWLRVISNEEHKRNVSWRIPDHPQRDARWEARRRRFVLPDSVWKYAGHVMRGKP